MSLQTRNLRESRDLLLRTSPADIAEVIQDLPAQDRAIVFRILPRELAADIFEYFDLDRQEQLLSELSDEHVAKMLNEMSADDRTALLEELPAPLAKRLIMLLSKEERAIAVALLNYPEGSVGRLMTPDYLAIRQDWSVAEVLDYVRRHGRDSDSLNILYIVDDRGKLIDDIRIRDVLLSRPDRHVSELMNHTFVHLTVNQDQEEAVKIFKKYDRTVLPVVDSQGSILGIVTIDDVFDVQEEEVTEDIQMIGGLEALDEPYITIPLHSLIVKRARWLVVLFVGEMLTATAMGYFEDEISRAVVLALFLPLIISSGGNSGSQAATLVIRALSVGEITLRDWWKVFRREFMSGIALGSILGVIGFIRIALWSTLLHVYGEHWVLVGVTVGCSLLAVVLWGTLSGSMLPFVLKRLGADPAASSAPFVATVVDVTGLIIYFTIASLVLSGILL